MEELQPWLDRGHTLREFLSPDTPRYLTTNTHSHTSFVFMCSKALVGMFIGSNWQMDIAQLDNSSSSCAGRRRVVDRSGVLVYA